MSKVLWYKCSKFVTNTKKIAIRMFLQETLSRQTDRDLLHVHFPAERFHRFCYGFWLVHCAFYGRCDIISLSSAEALSLEKRRENGEKETKRGHWKLVSAWGTKGRGKALPRLYSLNFPLPRLCSLYFDFQLERLCGGERYHLITLFSSHINQNWAYLMTPGSFAD